MVNMASIALERIHKPLEEQSESDTSLKNLKRSVLIIVNYYHCYASVFFKHY